MNHQPDESTPVLIPTQLALDVNKFARFALMCAQANPGIASQVLVVGDVTAAAGAVLSQRRIALLDVTAEDVVRKDPAALGGQLRFPGAYFAPTRRQLEAVPADRLIRSLSDLIVPHGVVFLAGRELQRHGDIREILTACGLNRSEDHPAVTTHILARKKHICCTDRDQELQDRSAIFEG